MKIEDILLGVLITLCIIAGLGVLYSSEENDKKNVVRNEISNYINNDCKYKISEDGYIIITCPVYSQIKKEAK